MRLFILVGVNLLIGLNLFSQEWPQHETWWAYRLTDSGNLRYQFLNVVRDSIIDNKKSRIIEETIFNYNVNPDTGEKILANVESNKSPILVLNSNDSIFYRYLEEWRFLYRFDLNVGQEYDLYGIDSTWCFEAGTQQEYMLPKSEKLKVIEIKSYDFVNTPVDEIIFEESSYWSFGNSGVLKNIGPKENFLPKPKCMPLNYLIGTDAITCFYSSDTGLIFVDEFNQDVCLQMQTVSISEEKVNPFNNKILIYPNPSRDRIFISDLEEEVKDILIYDYGANFVLSAVYDVQGLNISNLTNGFYMIQIISEANQYFTSFVKF